MRALLLAATLALVAPAILASSTYEYDGKAGDANGTSIPPIVTRGVEFELHLAAGERLDARVTWADPSTELFVTVAGPGTASPLGCQGDASGAPGSGERSLAFTAQADGYYRVVVVPDRTLVVVPFHLSLAVNDEAPSRVSALDAYYGWVGIAACDLP